MLYRQPLSTFYERILRLAWGAVCSLTYTGVG